MVMLLIKIKFIVCLLVTKFFTTTSIQYEKTVNGLFEKADVPKPGVITMLNRKVFKGERVSIIEHPYIVSVRRLYSHYLTGTLVSKNLVITAAHPLYLVSPCDLGVVVGENYSNRGTAMLTIVLVIIHEEFDPYSLKGDIALLRLYEDVHIRLAVKALSLISPYISINGLTGFVTGWGRCDNTGKELCLPRSSKYFLGERLDPMLRAIKFTVSTDDPHCDAYMTAGEKLYEGMLCVGPSRLDEPMCPCMAIPGAPLVVNSRLAGIQSWGFGCGYTSDLPIVYTNIQYYVSWLVFNIPILRKITKNNLTDFYKATKMKMLYDWLAITTKIKPIFGNVSLHDMQAKEVDKILTKLRGNLYDVRDFIEGGRYHEAKLELYKAMQLAVYNKETIKKAGSMRMLDVKPFLGNDTIVKFGVVVKNGMVSCNDSNSDP